MKVKYIALVISLCMLLASVIIVGNFVISKKRIYDSGYDYVEDDRTANVNVMLNRPAGWEKIQTGRIALSGDIFEVIDGSTATIPVTAELARQFLDASDSDIDNYVDHNTTHKAYENLIYSSANISRSEKRYQYKEIIFVTEPSEDELAMAEEYGVTLEIEPIALDGFVFITHRDNPIDSLTVEQIQGIYSGKITNWKEIGGEDTEIIPYQREANSGSQTAMEQMVMSGEELMKPKIGYTISTMGGLIEKVGEYQNSTKSIGYTYLYYINNLYRSEDIKVLKIDGIYPDNENLLSGSYPFTAAYYEVKTDKTAPEAAALYDYLLTEEGQRIVGLAGYCPVGVGGDGDED